jgi:hypothetical protein
MDLADKTKLESPPPGHYCPDYKDSKFGISFA